MKRIFGGPKKALAITFLSSAALASSTLQISSYTHGLFTDENYATVETSDGRFVGVIHQSDLKKALGVTKSTFRIFLDTPIERISELISSGLLPLYRQIDDALAFRNRIPTAEVSGWITSRPAPTIEGTASTATPAHLDKCRPNLGALARRISGSTGRPTTGLLISGIVK